MEKWRTKGKSLPKEASVLPPTRRSSGQNCLPLEKKKDRKWSFGGLLRRISPGQNNEASSNEEDITYIPGHMLAKKQTKKISKMKSKIGKMPRNEADESKSEITGRNCHTTKDDRLQVSVENSDATIDRSRDSLYGLCSDSINSPSSDGSLDALGKNSRISRMKARVEAKRDRLRVDSSSEDDSHKSSQSSIKFRSEDSFSQQRIIQRVDSCNRRTRGARTERYIKRMSRDDCNSSSDGKTQKRVSSSYGEVSLESFLCQPDSYIRKTIDSSRISSPGGSSSGIVRLHGLVDDDRNHSKFNERRYHSGLSGVLVHDHDRTEERDCEKFTWPKTNFRRTSPGNEIYGSLRPRTIKVNEASESNKVLPPEPPPRSSKSRIFSNLSSAPFNNHPVTRESQKRYYQPRETTNIRSYNSDNEIFHSNCSADMKNSPANLPTESLSRYDNEAFNSLDRTHRRSDIANRSKHSHHAGRTGDDADRFSNEILPSNNQARTTCSLPKGVELFSRQRLLNSSPNGVDHKVPQLAPFNDSKLTSYPVPRRRSHRDSSQSPESRKMFDDNEAQRRRSSRNLQEALFELEAIYNSLRLSDPDLLERAEQRTMDEYRDKAAKNDAEYSSKNCADKPLNNNHECFPSSQADANLRMSDDMAYRRMHPKERPSSVNGQSSVSRISYLATSPNLSIRDGDSIQQRSRRSSPDLTRDDLLYRNISHAINTLKVIEPQPPFGIPLGPVTGATESDYLHVKPTPTKYKQTRSLYIPKTEPDVVSDDLAFRNLRKDKDNWIGTNKNSNVYLQADSLIEPRSMAKLDTSSLDTVNKRAVRSNSADLISNRDTDWYNDYVRSTQKLRFFTDHRNHLNNDHITGGPKPSEISDVYNYRNTSDLDINGNRPKSALRQKIQVNVPRETPPSDNDKCLSDRDSSLPNNSRDSQKPMTTMESADSSPERFCVSQDSSTSDFQHGDKENKIEQFTEQEISEYKKLCQDLEKLIRQTADEAMEKTREIGNEDTAREENNSQSEIDDWEKMFSDDYEVPDSILNFNDCLGIPNTARDDDRCWSVGLSNKNSVTLPKNRIDEPRNEGISSPAGESGICGKSAGTPDGVHVKCHQLLNEVNDAPLAESTNKIGEYPTDDVAATPKDLSGYESNVQRILSSIKNDEKSEINDERNARILKNSSRVPQLGRTSLPTYKQTVDQRSTKNLEDLKSLTRRMRNEEKSEKSSESRREESARAERRNDDDRTAAYREGSNGGTGTRSDQTDKLRYDRSLALNFESNIPSDREMLSGEVRNEFDRLFGEVNDVPLGEIANKFGESPVEGYAAMTKGTVNSKIDCDSSSLKNIENPRESVGSPKEASTCSKNASGIRDREQYTMENLKRLRGLTRRAKNEEKNNEINRTMGEAKAEPELRDDTETFACREGEKRSVDEAACNDDACAFKDTSVHKFRKVSYVTNSITVCDVVLCSFFLTLLITILFAQ